MVLQFLLWATKYGISFLSHLASKATSKGAARRKQVVQASEGLPDVLRLVVRCLLSVLQATKLRALMLIDYDQPPAPYRTANSRIAVSRNRQL
jgi:hypothetical protein